MTCENCGREYGCIEGIPDLRVEVPSWIDFEDDLQLARSLAARKDASAAELLHEVFSRRAEWNSERVSLRTQQVLDAPKRLDRDVQEWLEPKLKAGQPFLDVGCGPGALLCAAVHRGHQGLGVDVSMTWLIIAQRMVRAHGGTSTFAAAAGEALPLRDGAVTTVVSLDVIEHVNDMPGLAAEIDRVTAPGGAAIISTPNRFSLTAEPHVGVWGVGLLPRPWQAPFVRWRSGLTYTNTRLLSSFGLRRLLRRSTTMQFRLAIPETPPEEIARFSPLKAGFARLYNIIRLYPPLRPIFLVIAPFFRAEGLKAWIISVVGGGLGFP
ncbi:bifunctional 2-polyprenyl-6-hydroxyphenol methylase/3-demethylubiquinol 3-O-methyltransferase UbiG [Phenylobacterium sp.]|uniref:class I SAM-dependent methyltransferase n=1 Tax=Phenylobacterium sp. TaxID=1871053 RepID=UPI0027345C9A|nr:class I SAM-dependent methyltransferase [Phenylobacterium sp.]MDP3659119.1 class I SAM-dependent methyltransferase [Phenylobacterium sp.]